MATHQKSRTDAGISSYTGKWGEEEVLHLLKRVHFGVKMSDFNHFKSKSLNEAITEILDIDYTLPDPPINNYNARTPDPLVADGETWVNDYNSALRVRRSQSFVSWWIGLMVNQDRTIREKMVLFWHNHFATELEVYNWPNYAYEYLQILRKDVLKNFKDLVKDITIDKAMLVYLNGQKNTKRAPDENYARELQELFTLGKGPGSQYTESDVIEAAKALTGWRINNTTRKTFFDPNQHLTVDKTFSAFYGNKVIKGKSGADGAAETDELIDMIFEKDEVAKHICRKLYRWFVYYEIDEAVEQNVILPLASILISNNYEMKPVLEALLSSEHFFDPVNRGAVIKSPIDFLVGTMRGFDVDFPLSSDYVNSYSAWLLLFSAAESQQQRLADPPGVAGWPAYHQSPVFYEIWINANTLSSRNQIGDLLMAQALKVGGKPFGIDVLKAAKQFSKVSNPNLFIEEVATFFYTLPISNNQKSYLKSILLSGQSEDFYWTNAWNDYVNDPTNTSKSNIVKLRLYSFFKHIVNLSEYQLS